jgi:hypothetical protein
VSHSGPAGGFLLRFRQRPQAEINVSVFIGFTWSLAWFRGSFSYLNDIKTLSQTTWFTDEKLAFQVRDSSQKKALFWFFLALNSRTASLIGLSFQMIYNQSIQFERSIVLESASFLPRRVRFSEGF